MALIDFILNIACLLLWLNWLSIRFDPLAKTSAASLVGTLKKAGQPGSRPWKFLGSLLALLLVRALAYWQMGAAIDWTPALDLGIVNLSFRSDYLVRMLLYSLLSFASTLAVFYLWMLLLSVVNCRVPDTDPLQKLVRPLLQMGGALAAVDQSAPTTHGRRIILADAASLACAPRHRAGK